MSDWAELPKHLLDSILERLELLADYFRFSIVCKSWYCIAKDNQIKREEMSSCHPPPMLLINTEKVDTWKVYNVIDNKLLDMQLKVPNTRFCGSSKGWLIFVKNNFTVTLVNPFFRVRGRGEKQHSVIHLPPLSPPESLYYWQRYDHYVHKATISADPILNANDCIVVVITEPCYTLAFIRLGTDKRWTYVGESMRCRGFEEVVFLEDKFYGVQNNSRIFSFEVTAQFNSDLKLAAHSIPPDHYIKRYLVYSNNKQLLMVQKYISFDDEDKRYTDKFEVHKLNFGKRKWIKTNTLGGVAIFLGDNSSFAVLASNFPGCLPNCIYFNHDSDSIYHGVGEPRDFGLYNVEEKRFLPIDTAYVSTLVKMSNQPAIWILPTFRL